MVSIFFSFFNFSMWTFFYFFCFLFFTFLIWMLTRAPLRPLNFAGWILRLGRTRWWFSIISGLALVFWTAMPTFLPIFCAWFLSIWLFFLSLFLSLIFIINLLGCKSLYFWWKNRLFWFFICQSVLWLFFIL